MKFHKRQGWETLLISTFPNTITNFFCTNLKYTNKCCYSTTLEDRLDHILVTWLHVKGGSKTYLQFACIMTSKREVPMSSFYSFNRASTFKPSSPNSFSKQYCAFSKARWVSNVLFCIRVQRISWIDDPNNIHEFLDWKPPNKLFIEVGNCNWTCCTFTLSTTY